MLGEAIRLFDELIRWPRGRKVQQPEGSGVYLTDWAMKHLGEARRLTARSPEELRNAAETFRSVAERFGQPESHLTEAQKGLLRECWWSIAEILFELRQWTQAKEYYRKVGRVFRTSPLSVWAYYQLGRCSEKAGDADEAKALYRYGQELLPGFTEAELAAVLPGGDGVRLFWNERFQLRLDRLALEE
jgi:tetratricopeptide (TPR) repeat protein